MSGLLSRYPPLRAQTAHGANQVVCALLCALSACPRWSSALRSCRSPAFPRFHSCAHTWLRPHATVWALLVFARVVEEQACCGRVCLRVVGFDVCATARVRVGVCAFLVLALWWGGGAVWSRRPTLRSLPSGGVGFWCSRPGVGAVGVCGVLRARWAEGRTGWGGTIVSRPNLCGVGYFGRPVARKREAWRVGCSRCANTRARAEREREREEGRGGGPRGADRGLGGGCGWWRVGW